MVAWYLVMQGLGEDSVSVVEEDDDEYEDGENDTDLQGSYLVA